MFSTGWFGRMAACIVLLGAVVLAARAAEERSATSTTPAVDRPRAADRARPETEIDISGPYHASIDGEGFPAQLDIWGPKATLKISMDGQDRPMTGMFLRDQLKVVAKYGAENFHLTTMVEARYDGVNFVGQYTRADEKLGLKKAKIVLTPAWHGGGGAAVKMPLPRRPDDLPGHYGLSLEKDGARINTEAQIRIEDGTVKLDAGDRRYTCDYSDKEMFPLFWEGNRMDTFRLTPTESGFKGQLVKEVNGKQEVFEVEMGKSTGGGGHDRHWTYVYDVIFNNQPPVYIGKITMHEDDATLMIELADGKATMKGSLVDNVLSGTGDYGRTAVSIRAQKTAQGFAGAYRQGSGSLVREVPVVLRNRPGRVAVGPAW
jgi:hypothetical protein